MIDLGVKHDLVDKSGAWYSYNDERIGQGKDNVRTFLKEHPEMAKDIDRRLRDVLLPGPERRSGDDEFDSETADQPETVEIP